MNGPIEASRPPCVQWLAELFQAAYLVGQVIRRLESGFRSLALSRRGRSPGRRIYDGLREDRRKVRGL